MGAGRKRNLDADIEAYLARGDRGDRGARPVRVDHSRIPREDLRIARENAARDPDGQTFPWLPSYPLAGATVVYDGRLWLVNGSRGKVIRITGEGHDDEAVVDRDDLRPVSWTQRDEDRYQLD